MRTEYKFTDGFLQDLQGEGVSVPFVQAVVANRAGVMLHDQDETRRFYSGVFRRAAGFTRN